MMTDNKIFSYGFVLKKYFKDGVQFKEYQGANLEWCLDLFLSDLEPESDYEFNERFEVVVRMPSGKIYDIYVEATRSIDFEIDDDWINYD